MAPEASSGLASGDTLHVLCFGSNIKVQASARHHMCAGRIGYSNVAMLKTYHDALQIGCRLSVTRQETRVALSLAFGNVSTVPARVPRIARDVSDSSAIRREGSAELEPAH